MLNELCLLTSPQNLFCGNDRPVENSYEFTTSLLKTLRVSNITTKYIFQPKCVKVYANLMRKSTRLLTFFIASAMISTFIASPFKDLSNSQIEQL